MKEKQAGDETNPYVSTFKYYSNEVAKDCTNQSFSVDERIKLHLI